MPRIFAPNETYNSTAGAVDFVNGAAAVSEKSANAIALFTALGFDVDHNKNILTALDTLTADQIRALCDYQGIAYLPADDKYAVIRKFETSVSTAKLGALTVASVAHGATMGKTVITVTEPLTGTNVHKYKTNAAIAPAPLYGDIADSTWTVMTSGAVAGITATTGHLITVVECDVLTGFIYKSGNDTVASKDA